MTLQERIESFVLLGEKLQSFLTPGLTDSKDNNILVNAEKLNPWFIPKFSIEAIKAISKSLSKENLYNWIQAYPKLAATNSKPKNIGVIMAGNIPLVGFNDLLCTLIAGHKFIGKPSSKDGGLMNYIINTLITVNTKFRERIKIEEDLLKDIDAIIATGSDNSSRYFEYYFSKYPHIIRKNRNSVAILSGDETEQEISDLADDVFLYFGLGCRSVSKLFVPDRYDFVSFFKTLECYNFVYNHNKYANNYEYNKAVFLMNKVKHLDNGFILVKEDNNYSSPIGVLFFEHYSDPKVLSSRLNNDKDQIQCIATNIESFNDSVPLGKTQYPELTQYADNVDTMSFLLNI